MQQKLPVRTITPISGSSRASVMQRMISSIVSGRNAFLFSGLLIVICASHPAQTSTHHCSNLAEGVAVNADVQHHQQSEM